MCSNKRPLPLLVSFSQGARRASGESTYMTYEASTGSSVGLQRIKTLQKTFAVSLRVCVAFCGLNRKLVEYTYSVVELQYITLVPIYLLYIIVCNCRTSAYRALFTVSSSVCIYSMMTFAVCGEGYTG